MEDRWEHRLFAFHERHGMADAASEEDRHPTRDAATDGDPDAAEQGVLGSDTHLALRKTRSKKILSELSEWLAAQKPLHVPKSPLGRAITYAQNNWAELERFTEDVRLPLDNNISERALRIIALGRKNYLFAGHDVGAENLCVLQTLVATCQANDVNPQDYLADVLVRVNTHPASQIDDLLPDAWQPAHAA